MLHLMNTGCHTLTFCSDSLAVVVIEVVGGRTEVAATAVVTTAAVVA